jgi:hypothetical protein
LATCYSNTEWQPWKFAKSSKNYWENSANRKKYLDYIKEEISWIFEGKLEGKWYLEVRSTIERSGGIQILDYFEGSLLKLLKEIFPHALVYLNLEPDG